MRLMLKTWIVILWASGTALAQGNASPTITCPGDMTVEATGPAGAAVTFDVTATDDSGIEPTITSTPASGSTFALGTTTVTSTATDADGGSATCTFDVTVVDTTPPTMNCPNDVTVEAANAAGATVTYNVTANDTVDGSLPVTCDWASGSIFPIGTTTVTCTATDAAGNTSTCTFQVTVADNTPPAISCPNDITVEATGAAGATVAYNVTANDTVDGFLPVSCDRASGSLFPIGTTTVTCTATDAAGNSSTCTFQVTVEDTTPPAIACPDNITVEATSAAGAAVTYNVTATDTVDGSPTVTCDRVSGSLFPIGTATVTCTATDAAGNSSTCTFQVTVADTIPPAIACPDDITAEATGPAGADVTYTPTATDTADDSPTLTCDPASGSVFSIGTTIVTCTATDAAGNSSTCTFTVTVVDAAAPSLVCPVNIAVEAAGPAGSVVTFAVTVTDNADPAPTLTCDPPSGSVFPIGITTVTCTAADAAGNTTQCTFLVAVGGADLVIVKSDAPDPIVLGEQLTYALTVTNKGENDATGVAVTDTLPSQATFVSATATQGTCQHANGIVVCNLGDLVNGASAIISIVVIPQSVEILTNVAMVTADQADPDPSNNDAVINTTVEPPDTDGDGINDLADNCPNVKNLNQFDTDEDGVGDLCDNCPNTPNPNQFDAGDNGIGDACEPDEPPVIQPVPEEVIEPPPGCGQGCLPMMIVSLMGLSLGRATNRRARF